MDNRINRFKLCDLRFYPYLRSVLRRLPQETAEIILNDMSFQILTDDEIQHALVLRYEFGAPIKTLVYLNTKILREPDHQILHTLATEIAHYILKKEKTDFRQTTLDDLLMQWGFGKEVEAVRYDQVVADSKAYKIGYDWAKNQDGDYLMQHFGLYFTQWNETGLGRLTHAEFEKLNRDAGTDSIFDRILQFAADDPGTAAKDGMLEAFSRRKTMLAGIMAASKELWL